ncbi:polyprenyl synthetase family protein [Microbacterium alcoholitolerans]|uniref:polyprenyl synthetase family protein n=1 Tax=unclassified Microbacterium TaxID=2609290 RepID=UPI003D171DAC
MSVAAMEAVTAAPRGRGQDGRVQEQLRLFFRSRAASAASYGPSFVRLWTLAEQSMRGGKLVRPQLLIDTFHALRPADGAREASGETAAESTTGAMIEIAVAVELLHHAFLMHDDVIDGDLTRRGRSNLVGALLAERPADAPSPDGSDLHWARTGAILMGDLLLAGVHQLFARARLPDATRIRLLDLLDHTISESVAGEELDVGLSAGVVAPDLMTILDMSRCKTAAYTFELPLRAAVALAGASADADAALSAAGRHLGLAFQLQDDLLSTFGDPRQHGKDPFSDLREGKQTAIIAYARGTSAWPVLESSFGRSDLTEGEGVEMRVLLADCGARRFVEELIDDELGACRSIIGDTAAGIPPAARRVLLDLIARLEGRRS